MPNLKLPVDFEAKVKQATSASGAGYPFRISARDLMQNFAYAALDAEDGWIEQSSVGSHKGRKLKLPQLPTSGTHVFGCVDGEIKWIEDTGGGGASGTFLASLVDEVINVTSGSYHILNSNTSVSAISGSGEFVYAVIEHSNAGIFESFQLEITSSAKQPTNLDPTGKFVHYSNILLAEKIGEVIVQRRVGNLSLVHQVVSGHICLWAYSSGGTSL